MAVDPETGGYMVDYPQSDDWFAQFQGSEGEGGITGTPQGIEPVRTGMPVNPTAGVKTATGTLGRDAFGQAWMASGGRTVEDLKAFVAAHPEFNVTLGGSKGDKVYGPGGEYWADAVIGAGSGGMGGSWQTESGGGSPTSLGQLSGTLMAPWEKPFAPRDPNQIMNDPAYQFQMGQGQQAIERSAAAKGTLLTGGTLKALQRYGQGLASTYNDKYYGRDLGEYNIDRENFWQSQDRPFSKLTTLAQLGKPAG